VYRRQVGDSKATKNKVCTNINYSGTPNHGQQLPTKRLFLVKRVLTSTEFSDEKMDA